MTVETRARAIDELTLWHVELEAEFSKLIPKVYLHTAEGPNDQQRAIAWRDADEAIRHTRSVLDRLKSALRSRSSNGHAYRGRKGYQVNRQPEARAS